MRGYEYLFGDAFEETIKSICDAPTYIGTKESFQIAVHQLNGISRFIHFMRLEEATTDAILMLSNCQCKMQRFVDNDELREGLIKFVKEQK